MTNTFIKAGDRHGDFVLKKSLYIEELQCTIKTIIHEPSTAEIVHIENIDPENVFCLAFRTLPENSNGVAHILEHTVLCGSKKFPVKDPFFSMTRRSLNTYMNALTYTDFTCYPAASQVEKDFYNLLDVYLDAVFHPQLKELSFLQEGHRLEFAELSNPKTPLQYKGIVYNEMKGALASPISRLWQAIMGSLFPDLLYQYNFGGEPKEIPTLTYQELIEFHQKFYQESRCCFYFYGNFATEKHLDFLNQHTLKHAKALSKLPYNPIQKHFDHPKTLSFSYPIAPSEEGTGKTYIALSWLTCPLSNQIDVLALQVLDLILMGTDAAPLKYKILRSSLCKNVFSNLEDELSQIPYSLIFEGCQEGDSEGIRKLTLEILREIASHPIDSDLIEAALHQLEFSRTEISGDYGPFGLSLLLKLVPLKNVGAELENNLKIHSLFDHLRTFLKQPDYLSKLIHTNFLDNTHSSLITMTPDQELAKREEQEEKKRLADIKAKLSPSQTELLVKKAQELREFQEKQEKQDLEVLPKVTLHDVSKKPKNLPISKEKIGNIHLFASPCFTNDVLYLDLVYKLPKIDFEDLPYVRLFTHLLPQMGAGNRSYEDHLRFIQSHTGGVSSFLDTSIPVTHLEEFSPHLVLLGKALSHKKNHLLNVLYDVATSPNFRDVGRIKELLSQHFVELDQDLKQNSLKYAANLSYSGLSVQSYIYYYWFGLGYHAFIKKIIQNLDQAIPALIDKLEYFKEKMLHGHDPHLVVSCDEKMLDQLKKEHFGKLTELKQNLFVPFERNFTPHKVTPQGRISSAPVFFTAMSMKTKGFADPEISDLSIAAKLVDNTVLHKLIREQGGAYGGGSSNRMGSGKFEFYSYRDPNLASTLKAFHLAAEKIAGGEFSQRELEEAKLGILQKLDHPILPEHRAYTTYMWMLEGKTYEMRNHLRIRILNATAQDIQKAVETKVLLQLDKATIVTFGSKEKLDQENLKLQEQGHSPLELKPI